MSKLAMLNSLDACDPMPAFGSNMESNSDPRLLVTQVQEHAADMLEVNACVNKLAFQRKNYTPELDKITGQKLAGLPAAKAPKKKLPAAPLAHTLDDLAAELASFEFIAIDVRDHLSSRLLAAYAQDQVDKLCGIPDSGAVEIPDSGAIRGGNPASCFPAGYEPSGFVRSQDGYNWLPLPGDHTLGEYANKWPDDRKVRVSLRSGKIIGPVSMLHIRGSIYLDHTRPSVYDYLAISVA